MAIKYRTLTVGVFNGRVRKGWAESALIMEDTTGDAAKRVVIVIDRPSDLSYLRILLDEIEENWKKQLADIAK